MVLRRSHRDDGICVIGGCRRGRPPSPDGGPAAAPVIAPLDRGTPGVEDVVTEGIDRDHRRSPVPPSSSRLPPGTAPVVANP